MHLDQWLKETYEEEVLTKEGQDLEATFDQMDPADLLKIACGEATVRVQQPLPPQPEPEKVAGPVTNLIKKYPLEVIGGGAIGTAVGLREMRKMKATPRTKLAFMDKVARQIARQHHEITKEAVLGLDAMEKTKEDEFTSPEAQQKAKVMQKSMKIAKNAAPPVRKKVISEAADALQGRDKTAAKKKDNSSALKLRAASGLGAAALGIGAAGMMIRRGRKDAKRLRDITNQFRKSEARVNRTLRATGLKK